MGEVIHSNGLPAHLHLEYDLKKGSLKLCLSPAAPPAIDHLIHRPITLQTTILDLVLAFDSISDLDRDSAYVQNICDINELKPKIRSEKNMEGSSQKWDYRPSGDARAESSARAAPTSAHQLTSRSEYRLSPAVTVTYFTRERKARSRRASRARGACVECVVRHNLKLSINNFISIKRRSRDGQGEVVALPSRRTKEIVNIIGGARAVAGGAGGRRRSGVISGAPRPRSSLLLFVRGKKRLSTIITGLAFESGHNSSRSGRSRRRSAARRVSERVVI
ncbi:hypothetical protein EVAR_34050_1 [Eumeta japonica]|uniref:Uncharacterized protein n=1 Tax=Eumeta variegata TaxID=151549 RepID=A0A4C1VTG2_EUMVA|nr:hypothetical protein EVAR_34050_1 [Eumeta japonica]